MPPEATKTVCETVKRLNSELNSELFITLKIPNYKIILICDGENNMTNIHYLILM